MTVRACRQGSQSIGRGVSGLSIVRTLVTADLNGGIEMRASEDLGHVGLVVDWPRASLREAEVSASSRDGGGWRRWRRILAALVLRGAAPHAGVLVVGQGEIQAGAADLDTPRTALAYAIWATAGPVEPTGKNRSGSFTAGGGCAPVVVLQEQRQTRALVRVTEPPGRFRSRDL